MGNSMEVEGNVVVIIVEEVRDAGRVVYKNVEAFRMKSKLTRRRDILNLVCGTGSTKLPCMKDPRKKQRHGNLQNSNSHHQKIPWE